jgi:acetate kinase
MNILVLNSGSSSIKYKLIEMGTETVLAAGLVERIGEETSIATHNRHPDTDSARKSTLEQAIADHGEGMQLVVSLLTAPDTGVIENVSAISAIGHRVVHGGEQFSDPTLIDAAVIAGIKKCIPLAPLHNPGCLAGIETALDLVPGAPQVAVFDTAFHQSLPPKAFRYALPHKYYEEFGIRRYGFHGTSHRYVTHEAARLLDMPLETLNLISLHLGNGASITAVRNGESVDTSMGMTPLAGVIMGTRSGDIDPAIIAYLADATPMSVTEINDMLSRRSGLKGLCGLNDLRDIHERIGDDDSTARLALEMLVYRYRHYIGAYFAVLERVDAIVFTAGIGENDPEVRRLTTEGLAHLGVVLDLDANRAWSGKAGMITTADSTVKVLVIPTNEELEIARQTEATI